MATIYKAPQDTNLPEFFSFVAGPPRIFLAGSIDMGKAENWQERIERELADLDIIICNPRRDDWDSTWVQSIDNPQFKEQVTWELDNIEASDLVVFYFDPNGPAPITLMELGLTANSTNVIVCCPDGYWRKGNVEVLCDRFTIPLTNNIDDFIELIKTTLKDFIYECV